MRAIVKFPLLVLLALIATEVTFDQSAIAGSSGITNPDSSSSGLGDNFGPDATDRPYTTIEAEAINTLQSFLRDGSVPSVDGQRLSISPEQISAIRSSLQASQNSNLDSILTQLEQQLAIETGDLGLEISRVGNSSGDLQAAVQSFNEMISGWNSQELAAAIESPTFMSLLRLLGDANTLLNSDPSIDFDEGEGAFGLLKIGPASERDTESAIPEVTPDEDDDDQADDQDVVQPELPAVREPIRGLW